MSLSPLYVFLGEVSVQVLCPFFNWVVCLPGVESCEFFLYFGDQVLVCGIIGKYVFPYCWFSFLVSLNNNLSFQPPLCSFETFSVSDYCPVSRSMLHILGFCNGSAYVSAIYCCRANYHPIKYPLQLFYLLRIWRLENSGWPQLANLCLIHLLSAGVMGAGYPLPRYLSCLTHMSSISVLLGLSLAPHGVSSSTSNSHGFCFSQHGPLKAVLLLRGSWLPRVRVPHDKK